MNTLVGIFTALSVLLIAAGVAQYVLGLIGGRVEARRSRKRSTLRRAWAVAGSDAAESFAFYIVIPCLNEAPVLANTLTEALASYATAKIIVVDDGSSDATAQIAEQADPPRVTVVHRRLPQAQLGKGPALNAGFAAVLADVGTSGFDPSQVVVCVMDAAESRMPAVGSVAPPEPARQLGSRRLRA